MTARYHSRTLPLDTLLHNVSLAVNRMQAILPTPNLKHGITSQGLTGDLAIPQAVWDSIEDVVQATAKLVGLRVDVRGAYHLGANRTIMVTFKKVPPVPLVPTAAAP